MKAAKLLAGGLLMVFGLGSSACSFHARDPESYREVTRNLVASKDSVIRQCYASELEQSPDAAGKVVVHFKVEQKSGTIVEPRLDEQATTAPENLGRCVTQAIEGLTLDPADARDGLATFTWDFRKQG